MADLLRFPDAESVADLGRLATRVRSLDADGALRLQSLGPVLAVWVGVLPGRGLMGDGTVLGLRTMALAEPVSIDVCVPAAAVADRTSRPGKEGTFPVPPTTLHPVWAALTPPRGGWAGVEEMPAAALVDVARAGIEEVGTGTPDGAGAAAVDALRARVWGRPAREGSAASAGLAFAAYVLGFLPPDDTARVARSGRWTRLTTRGGYVLAR